MPNMISISDINSEQIVQRLRLLIETNKDGSYKIEKLAQEINLKFQHCFSKTLEIMNLLKTILTEFRLAFYDGKNKTEFEKEIISCDLLFKKIDLVENEWLVQLYGPEQVNSLQTIKSQIELDTDKAQEAVDKLEGALDMYKSLGKEFETILCAYSELKVQYERKKYTIEKLKGDEIIF
jgi:hypothetical protein